MNEANYASLEASKRLVDAGIVLETEAVWLYSSPSNTWHLVPRNGLHSCFVKGLEVIPAPSMAEVWRELPKHEHTVRYWAFLELSKTINFQGEEVTYAGYLRDGIASRDYTNTNPTDALIDLLIWRRKEANHA